MGINISTTVRYAKIGDLLSQKRWYLDPSQICRLATHCNACLTNFNALANLARSRGNLRAWRSKPKHHQMQELFEYWVPLTGLNPLVVQCYRGEDMIRVCKKGAGKLHPATMADRSLQQWGKERGIVWGDIRDGLAPFPTATLPFCS